MFEYGITKHRLLEGDDPETSDDWNLGHPILFPNILAVGDDRLPEFQIRVPMDDEYTLHFWYWTRPRQPGAPPQSPHDIKVAENPYRHENGRLVVETVNGQDMMAWVVQGPVADRTAEHLGTSDKGVILLRQVLHEQLARVERGEDPLGVVRDPAKNHPLIPIPREHHAHYTIGNFVPMESAAAPAAQAVLAGRPG
jgi:5,5'-dehydrodivanillate O-demethylase